jgi:LuxR family maltose regulon positive regulatory protein
MKLHRELATAYVAIARRDWSRALLVLEGAGTLADQLRRCRECIAIKLLRVLALRASGEDASALMQEATGLAEAYGLRRVILDTHPDLAQTRVSRETMQANPGQMPRVTPSALLTPKEQQVLQLLARRLSRKQIAAALDVGDATVKWHLKNVFVKLNAGTREHALQRARMLGILETA